MNQAAPLVSFLLMSYNQEALVAQAIDGALAQDHPNLEIIVSDDCSTDGTFARIEHALAGYSGPHAVRARRTASNRGLSAHLSELVAEARGEFIVIAAGDDISLPRRASRLAAQWQALAGRPVLLYSDYIPTDLASQTLSSVPGEIYRGEHRIAEMAAGIVQVHGGTMGFTRSLYSAFPTMIPTVVYEDRVLPFRSLLLGGEVIFVEEPLVRYRIEGGISRGQLGGGERRLQEYELRITRRHLSDAIQRLADAAFTRPQDLALIRSCSATIADHLARIDYASSRAWGYELLLARHLATSARPRAAVMNYLRYRLSPLYHLRQKRAEQSSRRDVVQ